MYSICKIFFWQEDGPLANGALCLCTPKHNGKSGTGFKLLVFMSCSIQKRIQDL